MRRERSVGCSFFLNYDLVRTMVPDKALLAVVCRKEAIKIQFPCGNPITVLKHYIALHQNGSAF